MTIFGTVPCFSRHIPDRSMKNNLLRFQLKWLVWMLPLMFILASCQKDDSPVTPPEPATIESPIIIAGYLPDYSFSSFDFDALNLLSRVYFFSVAPDSSGNFVISPEMTAHIREVKSAIGNQNIELFLVLGGWYESENIFPMAASAEKRAQYVADITDFCVSEKLAGVDLDWEDYPQSIPQQDYEALCSDLSASLHKQKLMFSVAATTYNVQRSLAVANYTDYINLMIYDSFDSNDNQATYQQFVSALTAFSQAGIPKAKLIGGVPFYGRKPWDNTSSEPSALTYRQIVAKYQPDVSMNKAGNYSYNGPDLLTQKTRYLIDNGYSGIMAWELTQDVAPGAATSLLRAIHTEATTAR